MTVPSLWALEQYTHNTHIQTQSHEHTQSLKYGGIRDNIYERTQGFTSRFSLSSYHISRLWRCRTHIAITGFESSCLNGSIASIAFVTYYSGYPSSLSSFLLDYIFCI